MSYATTFNGGNSMSVGFSNKYAGKKRYPNAFPPGIQEKNKKH